MKPQIENLGKVSVTVESEYWSKDRQYDRLVIVEDSNTIASYISRQEVPSGINITNREYWIPIGRVSDYLENFVEEEKGLLEYYIQEINKALENIQDFHNTAYNEIQQLTDEIIERLNQGIITLAQTNQTCQDNENSRVNAENTRVATENTRVSKENERIANEELRIAAELNRELAEEERQRKYTSEYDAYENNRRNAETLRNAAESARQEQEAYRISNEETRQNNDSIRTGNENVRQSAETSRQQGEQARVTAETARVVAETNRQLQEGNHTDKPDANGSRWARYNKAEADRTAIAQQEENTRQSNFTTAETTRQNTFTTNEGKYSDAANANGSRWARFNKALNDATTALNNKITEIQNKANQDLGDLSELAETANEIKDALEVTPKIDGSYESMTVGTATTLINDSNIDLTTTYTHMYEDLNYTNFSKSGGIDDGIGSISEINVCSGFYNQLIKTNYEYDSNGVHVKSENNIITLSGTTDANGEVCIYPHDEYLLRFKNNNVVFTIYHVEGDSKSFNLDRKYTGSQSSASHYINYAQYGTNVITNKCYSKYESINTNAVNTDIYLKFTPNSVINCKLIILLTNVDLLFTYKGVTIKSLYESYGDIVKDISFNPGTLISCKNIKIQGRTNNLMDGINVVTGSMVNNYPDYTTGSKKIPDRLIPVKPNTKYKYSTPYAEAGSNTFYGYDKNKQYLPNSVSKNSDLKIITTKDNCYYICGTLDCSSNRNINAIYEDDVRTINSNSNKNINIDCTKISIQYNNCTINYKEGLIGVSDGESSYYTKPDIEFKDGKTYLGLYYHLFKLEGVPEIINTSIGTVIKYRNDYISFNGIFQIYIKYNNELIKSTKYYNASSFDITDETILNTLLEQKTIATYTLREYIDVYYLVQSDDVNNVINNLEGYVRTRLTSGYPYSFEIENINNEFTTYRDGALYVTPNMRSIIGRLPLSVQSTVKSLPKNYLNKTSLDSLLSALNTATGKTINALYNETTQSYDFTVK